MSLLGEGSDSVELGCTSGLLHLLLSLDLDLYFFCSFLLIFYCLKMLEILRELLPSENLILILYLYKELLDLVLQHRLLWGGVRLHFFKCIFSFSEEDLLLHPPKLILLKIRLSLHLQLA